MSHNTQFPHKLWFVSNFELSLGLQVSSWGECYITAIDKCEGAGREWKPTASNLVFYTWNLSIYINLSPICHNGIGWSHNIFKFICILSTLRYLWYSNPWFSHAIFQINLMMPWLSLLQCLKFEYDVMWSNHKKERKLGLVTRPLFQKFIIVIF
jgi:hypothetical protein